MAHAVAEPAPAVAAQQIGRWRDDTLVAIGEARGDRLGCARQLHRIARRHAEIRKNFQRMRIGRRRRVVRQGLRESAEEAVRVERGDLRGRGAGSGRGGGIGGIAARRRNRYRARVARVDAQRCDADGALQLAHRRQIAGAVRLDAHAHPCVAGRHVDALHALGQIALPTRADESNRLRLDACGAGGELRTGRPDDVGPHIEHTGVDVATVRVGQRYDHRLATDVQPAGRVERVETRLLRVGCADRRQGLRVAQRIERRLARIGADRRVARDAHQHQRIAEYIRIGDLVLDPAVGFLRRGRSRRTTSQKCEACERCAGPVKRKQFLAIFYHSFRWQNVRS